MVGVSAAIFSSIYILRRNNLNYFSDHSNKAFAQCRKTDEQKVARIRFWPEICHFAPWCLPEKYFFSRIFLGGGARALPPPRLLRLDAKKQTSPMDMMALQVSNI